jgi:hypothetical protein
MCLTLDDQEAGRSYKPSPPLSLAENHVPSLSYWISSIGILLGHIAKNPQDNTRGRNVNGFDRFAPSKSLGWGEDARRSKHTVQKRWLWKCRHDYMSRYGMNSKWGRKGILQNVSNMT